MKWKRSTNPVLPITCARFGGRFFCQSRLQAHVGQPLQSGRHIKWLDLTSQTDCTNPFSRYDLRTRSHEQVNPNTSRCIHLANCFEKGYGFFGRMRSALPMLTPFV